ncbi:MAG TPA: cytochrome c oxidase subunit II [Steroidobacteraceae bacterium]
MNGLHLFIPEASSTAPKIDALFWSMIALCGLVALGVFIAMIFYCIRYRRGSSADRTGRHNQSLGVELTWTLVPFALFVGVFVWSLFLFAQARTPPRNAQTLYVVAKQWMWKVQHPGGQREINTLHVPLGEPVRLTMTSQDVIHSFYVPAFRVKQDVLPGRYTQLWFTATSLGAFPLFCAEYCGLDHSKMGGAVVVMSPAEYALWLTGHDTGESLATRGAALFRSRGCSGCHGTNASVHAPDLAGLYGRPVHLSDGTTVLADERYLHDSILLPDLQVVAGYAPLMPSFSGQLTEEDLLALIAYIKSISPVANTEATHERR